MIDHLSIKAKVQKASRAFYETALGPLGYEVVAEFEEGSVVGMGVGGKPDFWLSPGDAVAPVHMAFSAPDRASVDAFHAAAIRAGGVDNGSPGLRPHYHPDYYGAFVLDPDGNNVEAVCHTAE